MQQNDVSKYYMGTFQSIYPRLATELSMPHCLATATAFCCFFLDLLLPFFNDLRSTEQNVSAVIFP